MSGMTEQDIAALSDLLVGVEMDRHSLPDGNAKVEALGRAIARLLGDGEQGQAVAHQCWSCEAPYTFSQRSDADGHCPACGVEIELEARPQPFAVAGDAVRALPAAWRATIDAASPMNRQDLRPIRFVLDLEAALSTQPAPSAQHEAAFLEGWNEAIEQFKVDEKTPLAWIGYSADGPEFETNKSHCEANPDYWKPLYVRPPELSAPSEQVAASVAVPEGWVSVADRMPQPYEHVEVWPDPRDPEHCYYASHDGGTNGVKAGNWYFNDRHGYDRKIEVTYWRSWSEPTAAPVAPEREGFAPKATDITCTLGCGCEEAGVCFAEAHGELAQCGLRDNREG